MPALRVELVAEEGRTAENMPEVQKPVLEQATAEGDELNVYEYARLDYHNLYYNCFDCSVDDAFIDNV